MKSELVKEKGVVYMVTKEEYLGKLHISRMPIDTYEETPIEENENPKRVKKEKEQPK